MCHVPCRGGCLYCCVVVSSVCLLCRLWVHALAVFKVFRIRFTERRVFARSPLTETKLWGWFGRCPFLPRISRFFLKDLGASKFYLKVSSIFGPLPVIFVTPRTFENTWYHSPTAFSAACCGVSMRSKWMQADLRPTLPKQIPNYIAYSSQTVWYP